VRGRERMKRVSPEPVCSWWIRNLPPQTSAVWVFPGVSVATVMRTWPLVASTSLPSGIVLVLENGMNLLVPFRRTLTVPLMTLTV
jgi:hypothetical protein